MQNDKEKFKSILKSVAKRHYTFDFCTLRFDFWIMYTKSNFYPKRPLHSFQDLEVYQKTLECSVLVAREVKKWLISTAADVPKPLPKPRSAGATSRKVQKGKSDIASTKSNICSGTGNMSSDIINEMIIKNMIPCALGIPHQVAEAHSLRFGDHTAGIAAIEKAMLNCNKIIVYLEQFRDIGDTGIEWEFFDDVIKKYLYVRRKMLNLERSWKKFMPGFEEKKSLS